VWVQALAMGGYGGYVWAAYGFTLVLMIGLLWQSWRLQRRRGHELAELRRTLRPGSGRPARRLVAQKPERPASGSGAAAAGERFGDERLASHRPTPGP
jgi:heme exporter protein CcmD